MPHWPRGNGKKGREGGRGIFPPLFRPVVATLLQRANCFFFPLNGLHLLFLGGLSPLGVESFSSSGHDRSVDRRPHRDISSHPFVSFFCWRRNKQRSFRLRIEAPNPRCLTHTQPMTRGKRKNGQVDGDARLSRSRKSGCCFFSFYLSTKTFGRNTKEVLPRFLFATEE